MCPIPSKNRNAPVQWVGPLAIFLPILISAVAQAQDRVTDTVHNLSASGPGAIRAQAEGQVCIFCHAPHNTAGTRPLWNREVSVGSYAIYESSTLDAEPDQPTGASKLCLSCHDGTIALGAVLSRFDRIRMASGDFLPAGLKNLGTDLSDDHPVSFFYTSGVAAADRQLADPVSLVGEVKLDETGQLQCTACHDPHYNVNDDFLVEPNVFGALCVACHQMSGWDNSPHRTSGAMVDAGGPADWPYGTVAENACRSCHRSHTAGGRSRLMVFEDEEGNCLVCHNGQVAQTNIRAEIDKLSAHDPRRYLDRHDPIETTGGTSPHVECADCHNAHAVLPTAVGPGYEPIGATLTGVSGISIGGAFVEAAQYEYEVCFKCHGDGAVPTPHHVSRQSDTTNLRLALSPTNPSFHPIALSASTTDTVSLVPELPSGSMIRCTDCHNNDSGVRAGGGGPDGPHGSNFDFLLERNYTVDDDRVESEYEYALCYKCHQRTSILGDQSFAFHQLHIVGARSPCSACHDPHGVSSTLDATSDHTHLINFDVQIVLPETSTLRREFRDLGTYAGSCTLVCHGEAHLDATYGLTQLTAPINRSGVQKRQP